MYASQITQILRGNPKTSQIFQGCFPCNQLPNPNTCKGRILIINLDPFGYEGSHWISLFVNKRNEVFYFDSLSLPTSICIINSFLKNFSKIVKNLKPYQNPDSKTCAHHCISFVYFISQGLNFTQYLKMLDKKPNTDLFVIKIVNKLIN